MSKRTTLADIAKAANVSMMTVSRAINNKSGLSDELRGRILALVEEMEYRPNSFARSLATQQTTTIGLVVPDITNPFFAQIARGVEDAAYENQYNIFLVNSNEDEHRETTALETLWQKGIDGIILCSSRLSDEALESQANRFPAMVLLNRELKEPHSNLITININDQWGAQRAIRHFVGIGRRRIAYIGGPPKSFSNARRLDGYKMGLQSAEIPFDPNLVVSAHPTTDGGRAAAAALIARVPDVNAVFCFNDLVAVGAMQVIQELGKKVPEDVMVIGVDDISLATIIRPQLTTMHVPLTHIGRLAMRALLDILAGDGMSAAYQIEPELFLRDSA
jgi:LacI family transcriptional regulator